MIFPNPNPLSSDKAKAISDWLHQPGCRLFQEYVANLAHGLTADAGNLLVKAEKNDDKEAQTKAEEARRYVAANDVIDMIKTPDYKFQVVELQPKPIIQA